MFFGVFLLSFCNEYVIASYPGLGTRLNMWYLDYIMYYKSRTIIHVILKSLIFTVIFWVSSPTMQSITTCTWQPSCQPGYMVVTTLFPGCYSANSKVVSPGSQTCYKLVSTLLHPGYNVATTLLSFCLVSTLSQSCCKEGIHVWVHRQSFFPEIWTQTGSSIFGHSHPSSCHHKGSIDWHTWHSWHSFNFQPFYHKAISKKWMKIKHCCTLHKNVYNHILHQGFTTVIFK